MKGQNKMAALIGSALIAIIGLYVMSVIITQLAPNNELFSQIIFGGGILATIIGAIILLIKSLGY